MTPAAPLALAQQLLTKPRMSNHARGLWGYTGETSSGRQLSIQSTGMGGPSAAIVLQELAALGVRRAIRVGTCGALDSNLAQGELLVAGDALAEDGASSALRRRKSPILIVTSPDGCPARSGNPGAGRIGDRPLL